MSRNILLIGGNSGIGLATARLLKSRGESLHAAARTPLPLASARDAGALVAAVRAALAVLRAPDVPSALFEAGFPIDRRGVDAASSRIWVHEFVLEDPHGAHIVLTDIRAAFEAMFANGNIQAYPERIHKIESLACAVHHLVERVEVITPQGPQQAWVIATNVYHKTPQGWRMVAHHTSPGTPHDAADQGIAPMVLH